MGSRKQDEPTHQPERVIVGHCPSCNRVLVLFNNHEVWSLFKCQCGWYGNTMSIKNRTRLENGGKIFDVYRPDFPDYPTWEAAAEQENDADEASV